LLFLLAFSAPLPAHAAPSDYELLVQRNLELREKIGVIEQKYTELENERNVLIGHVRNLQQEKERLLSVQTDVKTDKRYQDLEAAFDEVSRKIEAAAQERDRLARELDLARRLQQDSQAAAKRMEAENARLLAQTSQDKRGSEEQRSRAAEQGKLASEKQTLEKQLRATQEDLESREKELSVSRSSCEADKTALKKDIEKIGKEKEKGSATAKSSCEADKTVLKKDFDKVRQENDSAQAKIHSLEQASSALGQRYDKLAGELKAAQNDLRANEDEWVREKKRLENEKSVFAGHVKTLEERIAASEKAWGAQRASYQAKEDEFKKAEEGNAGAHKEQAIELAFYRAREADLAQKHKTLLSEYDRLKADVQRLAKVNAALKDTEQKLQQAKQELDAAHAGSRKLETQNKKLENKLTKLSIFKTRVKQTEEDLRALQMLKKEHEAMIRQLTLEKTVLKKGTAPFYPGAKKDKRALSLADKQKLDMHFNLAVAFDRTKMYKAEEREYMECLRIDPNDANVHYNLGILYDDRLNDNAKAVKHYRRFLELRPVSEDSEQVKEWIVHAEQQQRL